jgi:K+-sensing histidine kinase KdpD
MSDINFTRYAPAQRASDLEISSQNSIFIKNTLLCYVLDAVPDLILIINKERQIVFSNLAVNKILGETEVNAVLGMRPGELLNCEYAFQNKSGCGTTEFCKTCGAVNAILTSQKGQKDSQECRIIQKDTLDALDLKVYTVPVSIEGSDFTVFSITDISHEKRRRMLEKIFFHDILNTATGLWGAAHLLQEESPEKRQEFDEILLNFTGILIEEIVAQRDLAAAEASELKVDPSDFYSLDLVNEVINIYGYQELGKDKTILVNPGSVNIMIHSDRKLLRRILSNLVKNALESSIGGDLITIDCIINCDQIEFRVHNREFIPQDIQHQIFHRSFSTKGIGRGIGTYSIKLLSEKYLMGKVSLRSTNKEGTTFTVKLPIILPSDFSV